jgi:thioredoxin 1
MTAESTAGSQPESVRHDIVLSEQEASIGVSRVIERSGKRLEVKIPARTQTGQTIRLRNAMRLTDGRDGDILVVVRVQTSAGGVLVVTDASFENEVLKSPIPVLVDFWAPWCGPCRVLAPVTEKLSGEYAGRVKFCKLNVDENRLASQRYQVMSIPTVMMFKKGLIADMSVGAVPETELRKKVEALL